MNSKVNNRWVKRKWVSGKGLLVALVVMVLGSTIGTGIVSAEGSRGTREKELSRNGQVHQERYDEILNNLDKYAYVEDFILTRYIPRDATESGWEDTKKSLTGSGMKSVHWYRENGKTIFSSASAERYEIAKDKFAGKNPKETQVTFGGDSRKVVWQLEFDGDMPISERKSVMPYQCKASIQYSGDPFSGAHGFVDWGSVAADVAHNGKFKKDAKLFIAGYGKGDVHDVGGAIRGHHLDLFMDNCEEGFKGGKTTGALVIFEKAKSTIQGKPVTKEILDKVMNGHKWGDGGADITLNGVEDKGNNATGNSGRKQFNPFKDQNIGTGIVGLDKSENVLPGETSYGLQVGSEKVYKGLRIVMYLMGAGLILFISLQMAGMVLVSKGDGYLIPPKAESMLYGESDGLGDSTKGYGKLIARNFLLLIIMLTVVLLGMYTGIQGHIYAGIEKVLSFII